MDASRDTVLIGFAVTIGITLLNVIANFVNTSRVLKNQKKTAHLVREDAHASENRDWLRNISAKLSEVQDEWEKVMLKSIVFLRSSDFENYTGVPYETLTEIRMKGLQIVELAGEVLKEEKEAFMNNQGGYEKDEHPSEVWNSFLDGINLSTFFANCQKTLVNEILQDDQT